VKRSLQIAGLDVAVREPAIFSSLRVAEARLGKPDRVQRPAKRAPYCFRVHTSFTVGGSSFRSSQKASFW
jgi:hypothetical protein